MCMWYIYKATQSFHFPRTKKLLHKSKHNTTKISKYSTLNIKTTFRWIFKLAYDWWRRIRKFLVGWAWGFIHRSWWMKYHCNMFRDTENINIFYTKHVEGCFVAGTKIYSPSFIFRQHSQIWKVSWLVEEHPFITTSRNSLLSLCSFGITVGT